MVRETVAGFAMSSARSFGRALGCELVVELSDHSIETSMEIPNETQRAWDENLYKRGNVFVKGFANPVKPSVTHTDNREELDTVEMEEGGENEADDDTDDERRLELVPSKRYKEYLNQHLISELVNPREQYKMILYLLIGLGAIGFLNAIITLYATGSF